MKSTLTATRKKLSSVPNNVFLDPEKKCQDVQDFERKLRDKVVGQEQAVSQLVQMYQTYVAGMASPGRPISNLLFLGPTGSGKTRAVEAAAEILFYNPQAFIKVNCAEFQHSHEITKLVGSPPGYIGHRETQAALTQEAIDRFHTGKISMTFVLFDEIEKASDALWKLLLGILDKATLTLGDNSKVDFSRTVVFMTSNLGASEMSRLASGGLGFMPTRVQDRVDLEEMDQRMYRTALDAAKQNFSPEFMNRLDSVVVFRSLGGDQLRTILDLELDNVQSRIAKSGANRAFTIRCTPGAKMFLLRQGTDLQYGARHLKRAIERHLVSPLSNLIISGQVGSGDSIKVGFTSKEARLNFSKQQVVFAKLDELGLGAARTERQSQAVSNSTGSHMGVAI